MEYAFYVPQICIQVKKQPLFFDNMTDLKKKSKKKISI